MKRNNMLIPLMNFSSLAALSDGQSLWEIVFSLVGISWVSPKTVKEALSSWKGSFVVKKM